MDQMNNKRKLNPAQRMKKNLRDRRRRLEQKTEYKRLQTSEADLEALLARLKNEIKESRENEERLNSQVSKLMDIIHQQRQQILELKKTLNQVDSWIDLDHFPSGNEEVAND